MVVFDKVLSLLCKIPQWVPMAFMREFNPLDSSVIIYFYFLDFRALSTAVIFFFSNRRIEIATCTEYTLDMPQKTVLTQCPRGKCHFTEGETEASKTNGSSASKHRF